MVGDGNNAAAVGDGIEAGKVQERDCCNSAVSRLAHCHRTAGKKLAATAAAGDTGHTQVQADHVHFLVHIRCSAVHKRDTSCVRVRVLSVSSSSKTVMQQENRKRRSGW